MTLVEQNEKRNEAVKPQHLTVNLRLLGVNLSC
jgi:hypothetical protein